MVLCFISCPKKVIWGKYRAFSMRPLKEEFMVSRIYCARRRVSCRLFLALRTMCSVFIFPVNNVACNARYSPLRYIICEMIWIIPNGPGALRASYGVGTRLIQVPIASVSLDLAFLYIAFGFLFKSSF